MKQFVLLMTFMLSALLPKALLAENRFDGIESDSLKGYTARPNQTVKRRDAAFWIGSDLEKTNHRYSGFTSAICYINWGGRYRFQCRPKWMIQADFGRSSTATPHISHVSITHTDVENRRYLNADTVALLRLSGYTIGASLVRELPLRLSLTGGLQVGYYNKAITEYSRSSVSQVELDASYSMGYTTAFTAAPDWVNPLQLALRFGLEKEIWRYLVLGVNVQQGITDLSKPGGGKPNMNTAWVAYAGFRF